MKQYYTADEAKLIREHTELSSREQRSRLGYLTVEELGMALKVGCDTLRRWIRHGTFPRGNHRIGRRFFYHRDELEFLTERYKEQDVRINTSGATSRVVRLAAQGYYSIRRAAHYLDMPQITLRSWLDKDQFPRPTHMLRGSLSPVYHYSELDQLKEQMPYFRQKENLE